MRGLLRRLCMPGSPIFRTMSSSSNGQPSMLQELKDRAGHFQSVHYSVKDRVAHIKLDRPERLNAIDAHMPFELQQAVEIANLDDAVKIILLYGNGGAFCAGYDMKKYAENAERGGVGNQKMPWDPYLDFKFMSRCNDAWMSLWRSEKPTVCKIERVAIGGGSDMALCCDLTIMADDAIIGYPPSRVWGCPTSAMWVYRVGMERAKRILFAGELISGTKAENIGLIGESVPADKLDEAVEKTISRIVTVPTNQLWFQKQVINQAVEQMGLFNTQRLATIFDGMSRHTPEGVSFQQRTQEVGFKQAVKERDAGAEAVWSNMLTPDKSKL